jgi:hypothetical protein
LYFVKVGLSISSANFPTHKLLTFLVLPENLICQNEAMDH